MFFRIKLSHEGFLLGESFWKFGFGLNLDSRGSRFAFFGFLLFSLKCLFCFAKVNRFESKRSSFGFAGLTGESRFIWMVARTFLGFRDVCFLFAKVDSGRVALRHI